MPHSPDDQLIESVQLRRRRLLHAMLFGSVRDRRAYSERLGLWLVSAFVTVAICAGCVAYSFITHLLANEAAKTRQQQEQMARATASASRTPGPTPTQSPSPTTGR